MTSGTYDVCVIGAGLVGLATAHALSEDMPGIATVVVDKEDNVAAHQSGHNSGVIHSGLYYRPGSLKARLAVDGARRMYRFCEENGIVHRRSGKLVIATSNTEIDALDELERRGRANGLGGLRRLGGGEIAELEPAAIGVGALHVPEAGVADFGSVARSLASSLVESVSDIRLVFKVESVEHRLDGVEIGSVEMPVRARVMVNCAGLHSDRVAAMSGVRSNVKIIPFRGEYYTLDPAAAGGIRALVYPVPDPRFPFLGVHFTRRWDDSVEVGPNALVALGREHYRDSRPNLADMLDVVGFPGFWRLASRHSVSGAKELFNSKSRRQYARLASRLVPGIEPGHLRKGGAGVRAQAVDRSGRILDDFVFEFTDRTVHVLNAPSPGATASLAIGRHIADQVAPLLRK